MVDLPFPLNGIMFAQNGDPFAFFFLPHLAVKSKHHPLPGFWTCHPDAGGLILFNETFDRQMRRGKKRKGQHFERKWSHLVKTEVSPYWRKLGDRHLGRPLFWWKDRHIGRKRKVCHLRRKDCHLGTGKGTTLHLSILLTYLLLRRILPANFTFFFVFLPTCVYFTNKHILHKYRHCVVCQ